MNVESISSFAENTSCNSVLNKKDEHFIISTCRRNTNMTMTPNHNALKNPDESTEDTDAEEKLLVVYFRSGKIGAAYYVLQTGELFILEEIVDRPPEFQMFSNLFRQVEPFMILLDGKNQSSFVQLVKTIVFKNDANDLGRCKLVFLSAKEYNYEACKRRILNLSLPREPPHCTEEERTLFLRTVVDFSQTQTVHSLGALLRYLDLHWSSLNVGLHNNPQFLSLRTISLRDIVTIDDDTYRGLQIFSTISHPSNFKRGVQGSNREGLSLFHLFSRCCSKVGQSKMRVLMQHPSRDIAELRRRQEVVAYFLRSQNDPLMRNICSALRFIRNVNGILAKVKALSAKPYQWKSLYNTLYNAVLICEMCENAGKSSSFLEQLASCDNKKLYEMALYMNRIIDFDQSKTEGKFTVKSGVDPELDRKKRTMASLHGLMSETAKVELERLPSFIEECSMLYMPHLGYLLAVKVWDGMGAREELPGLKFMFQNNEFVHYKSKGCEELDVMIGDTYPEIVAHETRIMMRLTAVLLEHLHTLASVIDNCAMLDCLIAISKTSKEFGYTQPTLVETKSISIKQGKHPLHMTTCEAFVPNDFESNEQVGCVKILTGPNSSGKSVYMKQIGLIVYLAHIGSFVPADSAVIGIVSHIFTRMQSTECIAAHMSAFLIDLRQMALVLQESTSSSLVLVDEFGKGTARRDGAALLAAALGAVLARARRPHVLLATHFLQLHHYIAPSPLLTFLTFDHVMRDGSPVFLYRARTGVAGAGLARHAAAGLGAPALRRADLLARCLQVIHCTIHYTLNI
uniref:DNA mismatch repair proteins mutS family domain-containing protein n=1 Tax=Bombyx mori TaxID=7091 RepID=A0A8R2QTI2_BOMMO|nr:mutS protein homolog 5-like [Bombyx mori]